MYAQNYKEPDEITIYLPGYNVTYRDLAMICYEVASTKVVAVGKDSVNDWTVKSNDYEILSFVSGCTISDFNIAKMIIKQMIQKAYEMAGTKRPFFKKSVAVCGRFSDCNISEVDRKVIEDLAYTFTRRSVLIVDNDINYLIQEEQQLCKDIDIVIGLGANNPEKFLSDKLKSIIEIGANMNVSKDKLIQMMEQL